MSLRGDLGTTPAERRRTRRPMHDDARDAGGVREPGAPQRGAWLRPRCRRILIARDPPMTNLLFCSSPSSARADVQRFVRTMTAGMIPS